MQCSAWKYKEGAEEQLNILKVTPNNFFFLHRGHLYHRDVCHDGLLEAEQLCGQPVL